MLKCNLNDLKTISNEEVQYSGFFCIKDFYMWLLSVCDTVKAADIEIEHAILRGFINRGNKFCPTKNHLKFDDKNCYSFYETIFKNIVDNYDKIYSMYPEFDKFISSRENTLSKELPGVFL